MKNWIIGLIITFTALAAGLFWGIYQMRIDWLQAIMLVFTYYGMMVIFAAATAKPKKVEKNNDYKPFISIIIPARNEEFVIENTVRSLLNLNYFDSKGKRNFEILVMDDNSADKTLEIAKKLEKEFPNEVIAVHRGPEAAGKGKSMVLNDGVKNSKGEVIAVFDADTSVSPNFFKNSIYLLADPKVGGLQGRVRLYNKDCNFLTKLQEDEFAVVSHLYQIGKELIGGLTALGGNGQLAKREALDTVGGWNWLSPTEDLDLTFRLLFKGWQVRYAPNAVLWQEGVEGFYPLLRQRIRWAEGFLKCIFDYTVPLIFCKSPFMKKFDGLMTMARVLIPFYVWIGYIFIAYTIIERVHFTSGINPIFMGVSSWAFLGAMTMAMFKTIHPNIFKAFWRVLQYSVYSLFWVLAVPVGYINCIRNINDIRWDKTTHNGGDEMFTPPPAVARKAEYTEAAA